MLRFPYRRTWPEPDSAGFESPHGLVGRLIRRIIGKRPEVRHSPARARGNTLRPLVTIRIRGPVAARRMRSALLDTGSQDTLFPMAIAQPLGIVLGGERYSLKWRGVRYWVEFHDVELELTTSELVWRWRTRVGFTSAPLPYALLGQRGCLNFLDAKFYGAHQMVELETNRAFPGSIVSCG